MNSSIENLDLNNLLNITVPTLHTVENKDDLNNIKNSNIGDIYLVRDTQETYVLTENNGYELICCIDTTIADTNRHYDSYDSYYNNSYRIPSKIHTNCRNCNAILKLNDADKDKLVTCEYCGTIQSIVEYI